MNYLHKTSTEKNHKNFPCCMTNGKKRLIFSASIITIKKNAKNYNKDKKPVIKFYLITEIVFSVVKFYLTTQNRPQKHEKNE